MSARQEVTVVHAFSALLESSKKTLGMPRASTVKQENTRSPLVQVRHVPPAQTTPRRRQEAPHPQRVPAMQDSRVRRAVLACNALRASTKLKPAIQRVFSAKGESSLPPLAPPPRAHAHSVQNCLHRLLAASSACAIPVLLGPMVGRVLGVKPGSSKVLRAQGRVRSVKKASFPERLEQERNRRALRVLRTHCRRQRARP